MPSPAPLVIFALAVAATPAARAGRPLATDDAAVAEARRCQVESWAERSRDERAGVLGATCGIGQDVDAGVELTRLRPRSGALGEAGAALKWAPSGDVATALGPLSAGLRLGVTTTRPVAGGWQVSGASALGIVTLDAGAGWQLHVNLGPQADRASHRRTTLLLAAAAWTPRPDTLLFAEIQGNDRRADFGGTVRTLGGRWWLLQDRLGLDIAASRVVGAPGTTWTVGFGWYGIGGAD